MYRSIESSIWKDPWFSELSAECKTLFMYAITNDRQTACGAFEVSLRQMAYEAGLTTEQVKKALTQLEPKVMWWPEWNILWVRNFYKYQHKNSNKDSFRQGALKAMYDYPQEVNDEIREAYPELDDVPD